MNDIKLFAGSAIPKLSADIADYYGQGLSELTLQRFSDGEMQLTLEESVRGAYVFFIQSTFAPSDNLIELLLLTDAARRASAHYITAVIPFFGYARQDRKDRSRVPISAKLMANLLVAAGIDRVMTMDLHAEQIQGFFDIPVDHLRSEAIFFPYLATQNLENTIFASPDVGSIKRARAYAQQFSTELIICDKYRKVANEIAGMNVIGDASGKHVILIDDLIDTGSTLCKAAEALIKQGALSVRAFCTHPVLSGKAYENIEQSQLSELVVTDTIPLRKKSDKIKVLSTAKLFAHAIRYTHEHKSMSGLFVNKDKN
jgi:ribose-phosphate pyrophosphokinase